MAYVRSIEELARVLAELGVPHELDPASRELRLSSDAALPGALCVRWDTGLAFLSLRHDVLADLPYLRFGELERAIAYANHQLPMPGFGLDHARHRLYYRVVAPIYGAIASDLVDRLARGVIATGEDFAAAFQAVVDGRAGSHIAEVYTAQRRTRAAAALYDGVL